MGWDGDPLGRITLGLLVSIGSTSGITGVVVTTEVDVPGTSQSSLPQTSDDTHIGLPVESFPFLSSTVAKNCRVDANASSLLTSLVLCILLGASLILLSGFIFNSVFEIPTFAVSEGASCGLSSGS